MTLDSPIKNDWYNFQSGGAAARAFLRHYCKTHLHKRKKSAMISREFFEAERKTIKYDGAFLEEPQSHSEDTLETRISSNSPARVITVTPDRSSAESPQRSSSQASKRSSSQTSKTSSGEGTSVNAHLMKQSNKSLQRTTPSQIDEESDEQYASSDDGKKLRRMGSDVSDISDITTLPKTR